MRAPAFQPTKIMGLWGKWLWTWWLKSWSIIITTADKSHTKSNLGQNTICFQHDSIVSIENNSLVKRQLYPQLKLDKGKCCCLVRAHWWVELHDMLKEILSCLSWEILRLWLLMSKNDNLNLFYFTEKLFQSWLLWHVLGSVPNRHVVFPWGKKICKPRHLYWTTVLHSSVSGTFHLYEKLQPLALWRVTWLILWILVLP